MKVNFYESNYGFGKIDDPETIREMKYNWLVSQLEDEMKHEFMRVNKIGAYSDSDPHTR